MPVRTLLFLTVALSAQPGDWIVGLGGKVERDAKGNAVAVNLRGSWLNDAEVSQLARLPGLERLDLSHTRISDEGLLRLKPAPKIRDLNLYYSEWITDQGMTAIANWKQLKRLNVRGTRISDGTLAIVGGITGLEALDIAHTPITENGLDRLITLINLKELAMGGSRRSNTGLQVLRMLPTLTHLDLSGARPTPPDMPGRETAGAGMPEESVRAIATLKNLRVLKLGHSDITPVGLPILAAALIKLERLGAEGCRRLNDSAIDTLAGWKSLKYVDLQDTQVTAEGLAALRKMRPDMAILP